MKQRNTELTKNYSKLLDSQQEDPWLMNHEIYKLNTKISASQVLAQKGKQKDNQTTKQIVPQEYHKYLLLFNKKKSEQFPPARPQDHKIKIKPTFKPKAFKPYKLFLQKLKSRRNLLKKIYKKDISSIQNHQWPHPSSLWPKRIENYDHAKTIDISMNIQSRMPILSPISKQFLTNYEDQNTSLQWTYNLNTTTFTFKNKINEKEYLELTKNYLNPLLCSLEYAIVLQYFK